MTKPIIFFSHSSKDSKSLQRLKQLFVQKTGGTIDVFLSSDGQSIKLGTNWVHRVEEALDHAKVMLLFVTPNSVASDWLFFESGFAYAKRIQVIPIGYLGFDIGKLTPPLSLLQGFNITSKDGLDNIIAIANSAFDHQHKNDFSEQDYQEVASESGSLSDAALGSHTNAIYEIEIVLDSGLIDISLPTDALAQLIDLLVRNGINYHESNTELCFPGASISRKYPFTGENRPQYCESLLDPRLAQITLPILEEWFKLMGFKHVPMKIDFISQVNYIYETHKITARMHRFNVMLQAGGYFNFRNLSFRLNKYQPIVGKYKWALRLTHLEIVTDENVFPLDTIKELIDILFEQEILYYENNRVAANANYIVRPGLSI